MGEVLLRKGVRQVLGNKTTAVSRTHHKLFNHIRLFERKLKIRKEMLGIVARSREVGGTEGRPE